MPLDISNAALKLLGSQKWLSTFWFFLFYFIQIGRNHRRFCISFPLIFPWLISLDKILGSIFVSVNFSYCDCLIENSHPRFFCYVWFLNIPRILVSLKSVRHSWDVIERTSYLIGIPPHMKNCLKLKIFDVGESFGGWCGFFLFFCTGLRDPIACSLLGGGSPSQNSGYNITILCPS